MRAGDLVASDGMGGAVPLRDGRGTVVVVLGWGAAGSGMAFPFAGWGRCGVVIERGQCQQARGLEVPAGEDVHGVTAAGPGGPGPAACVGHRQSQPDARHCERHEH